MSTKKLQDNSYNPFFDDDDDDDEFSYGRLSSSTTTKNHSKPPPSRSFGGAYGGGVVQGVSDADFARPKSYKRFDQEDQLDSIQAQVDNSKNRQLQSTQRCMASIYESERMGVATAEELLHQREQLDNVERMTDKINADTKITQSHLNGIKSVFGGFKNWWNKDKKETQPESVEQKQTSKNLAATIEKSRSDTDHPALGLRNDDYSGFYSDSQQPTSSVTQHEPQRQAMDSYEREFQNNVSAMSDGMSRLKGLAQGLGDEIVDQNQQLGRIQPKMEKADSTIRDQNRQMYRILGK